MKSDFLLVCCPKQWISDPSLGKHCSVDVDLHVLNGERRVEPRFELMCAAIDDAIHGRHLQAVLDDIAEVESGRSEVVEEETEAWLFWIRSEAVTFEGKFNQGSGGDVTLEQFKLAVSTFRAFLNDPERKPVEVLFPPTSPLDSPTSGTPSPG